jgi:hypothetical protein
MKFGALPPAEAVGAMAAHSLRLPGLVVKKGAVSTWTDTPLINGVLSVPIDHSQ